MCEKLLITKIDRKENSCLKKNPKEKNKPNKIISHNDMKQENQ